MQKISQSFCLIAFLMLVATTCMAGTKVNQAKVASHPKSSLKKLGTTYCTTSTIHDYACHDRCHNTTTYIHDCDIYNGDSCDNFTTHLDICNATICHNTTRHVNACYSDVSDLCGNADLTFHCCTNGVCRNRTTHIHLCLTDNPLNVAAAAAMNGVRDIFDACGDRIPFFDTAHLITGARRRFGIGK